METQNPNSTSLAKQEFSKGGIVAGDIVNQATVDLPDDQRAAIRWLHAYQCEHNLSVDELATHIKRGGNRSYDGSTLYRVFRGINEGGLTNITRAISDFRKYVEDRATIKRVPFIETSVSEEIFQHCQVALRTNKVGFIFGNQQIGKSAALEEYTRTHNHGETRYVRMPAGGGKKDFLEELAITLRISAQHTPREIRRRIVRAFDNRMLLIIDEAHQLFSHSPRPDTAELIREIFDRCQCGLILCGTRLFQQEMREGRFSILLQQLNRRKFADLVLDDVLPAADLNKIAAAYGLPKAEGDYQKLQRDINEREGVGRWFTYLLLASDIAGKRKQKLSWDHVRETYEGLIDRDELKRLAEERKRRQQ
ncbi:MAG TPA: ATP-binding protein [Verrucomicrobiae bacterium]|nr:ATP-binding protein [Verrucomicrobiae bacterium]